MKINLEHEFEFFRCQNCGINYTVEKFVKWKARGCPICGPVKESKKEREIESLKRSIIGLRQYIKRQKGAGL